MNPFKELLKWSRPEYRERHVFVVKLRLAVLVGFWFFYLSILWEVLDQALLITGVMVACFVVTSVASYNVLRGKWLLKSIITEIISDLVAITGIIYLSGGPYSDFFTIYIFYILAAGLFFDHLVAAFLALCSALSYGLFLWLCQAGIIRPLILKFGDEIPAQTHTPSHHYLFTVAFLLLAIYAVKIASTFSGRRERELERLSHESAMLIERLRRTNEELREANRVKSDFLATMSHELRTPLTAIIGFSELLLEGVMGELTLEQKESVQEVLQNGGSLLSLINSLLDLAKVEAGKMSLDVREFQVAQLLHRVQRMIDSLVKRKQQQLRVQVDDALPVCQADELKLQQILLNLLSNAIKFTPRGGEIVLAARRSSSGSIEFSVADNGIGIPADQLETIFEPFYQVDSSMTRAYGGTGLGLALAKQFVEMHGGNIWATSEANNGTTFTFYLPSIRSREVNSRSLSAGGDPGSPPAPPSGTHFARRVPRT